MCDNRSSLGFEGSCGLHWSVLAYKMLVFGKASMKTRFWISGLVGQFWSVPGV